MRILFHRYVHSNLVILCPDFFHLLFPHTFISIFLYYDRSGRKGGMRAPNAQVCTLTPLQGSWAFNNQAGAGGSIWEEQRQAPESMNQQEQGSLRLDSHEPGLLWYGPNLDTVLRPPPSPLPQPQPDPTCRSWDAKQSHSTCALQVGHCGCFPQRVCWCSGQSNQKIGRQVT